MGKQGPDRSASAGGEAAAQPSLGVGEAQELLSLAHDAIILRAATGEIRFWNRGAEQTYGWSPAEALGQGVYDLLRTSQSSRQVVERGLQSLGSWEGELTHLRKDGSAVVVASRQVVRQGADGLATAVLEINRDVTEARQAQYRLKESEERFRLMVEGVKDYAIFMLDPDGFVVSWNAGAERLKGYHAEEIRGHHFSLFYPLEDVKAHKPADSLRKAAALGRSEDEGWRVRKDGSRFWASVVITALRTPAGGLRGFAKVTRDFTERRKLQERLEYQARLLDQVNDAVLATDENLVLTAWNAGAERLYGWRADEVLGKSTVDVLQSELLDSDREEALRVLSEGGEWHGEVVQRHKDGRQVYVDAAAVVLRNGPTRIVTVNRDIGERKRALVLEERSRIARELHDSVSQALFSMTLQARALQLAAERENYDPDGSVAHGIANIRQLTQGALAEMRALIFELRPDALAEEGLVAALRKHAAALEAREGLTVETSVPSDPISFESGVEENLYRLAQEALWNVVKHAAASTVRLRLAQQDSGGIELEITDDGVGFDTSISRPGHIGLRTMSERAAHIGGTLEVTSEPGSGTRVWASVPPRREDR